MERTADIRIVNVRKLASPRQLKEEYPITEGSAALVSRSRAHIQDILDRKDQRLLAIVGPCSIHDPASALEYAHRLRRLAEEVEERLYLVMRVYFEKPRTSIGWRGLILDPALDGSYDIETGLRVARRILLEVTSLGLPTATEVLDPIVPQYLADLVCWAAVGARTTESQTHREMASGLSMPVGFKNGTDGSLDNAIHAIVSAAQPRSFIGISQEGETAVLTTTGNPWGHLILRGGHHGPNFAPEHIQAAAQKLERHGLRRFVMVDCSHANSGKDPERQPEVLSSLIESRRRGLPVGGLMLESHLFPGRQEPGPLGTLRYGVSITDACLGWEATRESLLRAAEALSRD